MVINIRNLFRLAYKFEICRINNCPPDAQSNFIQGLFQTQKP